MSRSRKAGWLIAILLACLVPLSCSSYGKDWAVGGVYSIGNGDGTFGVVKILAIDPDAVSVRVYRNSFPDRPKSVDPPLRTLGRLGDQEGFGIGHLPLAHRDFALWFPVLLFKEKVGEDEQKGYKMWKESGGGVFKGFESAPSSSPNKTESSGGNQHE